MTIKTWGAMHDATLESMELYWASGEAVLRIRTGDPTHPQCVVVASAVRWIGCDRHLPWGFSVSINEVRGPVAVGDDASVLEIEMQSGDLIRIEAASFCLRDSE